MRCLRVAVGWQSRVLHGRAVRLGDGVASLVALDFCFGRPVQIDARYVGQSREINEDVSHLVFDGVAQWRFRLQTRLDLRVAEPLQFRHQLTDLTRERHREVLRAVELIPVSSGSELPEADHEFGVVPMAHGNASGPGVDDGVTGATSWPTLGEHTQC